MSDEGMEFVCKLEFKLNEDEREIEAWFYIGGADPSLPTFKLEYAYIGSVHYELASCSTDAFEIWKEAMIKIYDNVSNRIMTITNGKRFEVTEEFINNYIANRSRAENYKIN